LTFSSDTDWADSESVSAILLAEGFQVAQDKTKKTKLGQANYVTGLSVSDSQSSHAPRKMKQSLRQELYYSEKFGLDDHLHKLGLSGDECQWHINRLDGLVKYVAYQEPKKAKVINHKWNTILRDSGASVSYSGRGRGIQPVWFYFDETDVIINGQLHLVVGFSVSYKQQQLHDVTCTLLDEFIADPYSDGSLDKKGILKRKGMHFTDATIGLRQKYFNELERMPFRGYIGYAPLNRPEDYRETYFRILKYLLPRRLITTSSAFAYFGFEENNKLGKESTAVSSFESLVNEELQKLKEKGSRCPEMIKVEQVSKPNSGISTPDFLLAAFKGYVEMPPLKEGTKERPQALFNFERMRDKIRLITNVDTQVEYGRRNPLEAPFE
jgi:hypothetical protein